MIDSRTLCRDFIVSPSAAPVWRPDRAPLPPEHLSCVIAIGVFDGLHRGHRALLDAAIRDARARGVAALAVTFDPDPDCVVTDHPAHKLMTVRDRLAALAASGVDGVFVIPFDERIAAMDHATFFQRVLFPFLDVHAIHVGADFRLGAGGTSTVEVIRSWARERGIEVTGHELVCDTGEPITASRIRGLLAAGLIDDAARELGRAYFVHGTVEHGRGEGSKLGFPTANVKLPRFIQRPLAGVYAGFVRNGSSAWPAAISVGFPPTFEREERTSELEAHLLGFSGDLYGEDVSVLFGTRLRSLKKFQTVEELVSAVRANIADTRARYGDAEIGLTRDL